MATQQRKETNILLTFKVLQFVNQVRRRVKTRFPDGSSSTCPLGAGALGYRAPNCISNRTTLIDRQPASHPRGPQHRVCKSHRNRFKRGNSALIARASASDVSANSDAAGGQVQHMISAVDELGREQNTALSTVANSNGLFLNHDNYPTIEGYSLNELVRLLITVQEAIATLTACRSQHGDGWLLDQGVALGLNLDETFIANYEHLLLRLRAELADALTRKTVEELLRGGHDKRQRKLLAWFSEFAEKPRPLSTSFPWTIKPSLAVLWGVCWMFYDREVQAGAAHDAKGGNDRVRRDRVLRKMDFPNVQWSAPASSDYVNFGLELIGAQPLHGTQQASQRTTSAGLDGMFQARNADTWESDLSPLEHFRLPSDAQVGAIGPSRYAAPPQLPSGNTYYQQDLALLQTNSPVDNYLPHSPGSPLTAFAHLGTDNSLNLPWHLPRNSLPHQDPRNLLSPQPPSIRVTSECDFTQPPGDFVPTFGVGYQSRIYHNPQAPSQLNTSFDFSIPYNNNMVSQISPEATAIQIPQIHTKHERTHSINSVSGMPTPASMSGQRSPLPSPTSGPSPHLDASPRGHSRRVSEDVSSVTSEEDGSMRKNHSYKRSEEPPRNSEGKMYCRYSECAGQLFDRKCEWSKHMDKHDRPYKCNVKGCEKLQGFTYSGGLLRHEREVHKMHGGTKKSLFCPFPDCKRSSGAGFTRKENLAEHVRRVHRRTSMSADMHGLIIRRDTLEPSPIPESRRASESPYVRNIEYREDDLSLKRKRGSDAGLSDRDNDELRAEIKRLRQENEDKDSRLQSLEQAVIALQHQARR